MAVEEKLRQYPTCVDAFKEGPLSGHAGTGHASVLLVVPDFFPSDLADRFIGMLVEMADSHSARISGSLDSSRAFQDFQYRTAQFMRGPCTCFYSYAGTSKHKRYSYRFGQGTPSPEVLIEIEDYLAEKLGLHMDQIPDCWVVNWYIDPDMYIDWHTDDDQLFDALNAETEIISITLGASAPFCYQPRKRTQTASDLQLPVKKTRAAIASRQLRGSVALHNGSISLMGGWFQREFEHRTIPASEWGSTWAIAAGDCGAPISYKNPRICLTGRFIRKHECPLKDIRPSPPPGPPPASSSRIEENFEVSRLRLELDAHEERHRN